MVMLIVSFLFLYFNYIDQIYFHHISMHGMIKLNYTCIYICIYIYVFDSMLRTSC